MKRITVLAIVLLSACQEPSDTFDFGTLGTDPGTSTGDSAESSGSSTGGSDDATGDSTGDEGSESGSDESGSSGESSTGGEPLCVDHEYNLQAPLVLDFTETECLADSELQLIGGTIVVDLTVYEEGQMVSCSDEVARDGLFYPLVDNCRQQLVDGYGCDTGILDYPGLAASICFHTIKDQVDQLGVTCGEMGC